ncbi:hypothetical protein CARUB_v10011882mg [Capsella rubella]|uniref:Homeobox domain-containing protein n=1 Tax=Capsella rubella TaxID=81985 RepID=R0GL00_9BRAS|nr:homeobox-leucine zipper protein HDG10 [Capsella rubella]EOA36637.1 hypothetical protein CARUB_v10011882mg [Capsella rubella]
MYSSSREDSSANERETSSGDTNANQEGSNHQHHSHHQTLSLEQYFTEREHPNSAQRHQLAEELNMKPEQIKFWFQNKRVQTKMNNEKAENAELRIDNLTLQCENEAMEQAMKTVVCPPCGGRNPGREEQLCHLENLRSENTFLQREHERLSSYVTQHRGSRLSIHGPSTYGSTSRTRPTPYGSSSNHRPKQSSLLRGPYARENINITPVPKPRKLVQLQHFQPMSRQEKAEMIETAENAVAEVMSLIRMDEPMWVKSPIDGRFVLDPVNYGSIFGKMSQFKTTSVCPRESSKEVVVVPMDATNLVDMLFDTEKWARLFPTIVNEAKTVHVLETINRRRPTFSRVIYENLHMLSPLVPPREFLILRTCQKMEDNLWLIADVSCHHRNIDYDSPVCTKRPSGVLIQGLAHGCSKVTWIEHVEVSNNLQPHRLYRDLLNSCFGYGARRWTVTLERMCERLSLYSMHEVPAADYVGVVRTIHGRRSIMNLGERMLKNFAWIMKMATKLDFSRPSDADNSKIRISVRTNTQAGQPVGLIVCASSSLSLPVPPVQVYNLLKNLEVRNQWDVLCHGNPVIEATRFVTGLKKKNNVTFLQTSSEGDNTEMMILQDSFIDELGGMVVYAPMDLKTAYAAISGDVDPSTIPILPSGFIISRDSRSFPGEQDGRCMTLLTLAFQILVSGSISSTELNLGDATTTVETLINCTVQRVKAMLNCG